MRLLPVVSPTPEQLTILQDSGPGFRLIRGAAGSGKTTTALLRLKQLCRSRMQRRKRLGSADPVRVLVLTYNRTLEGYIAELAKSQVSHEPGLLLEVSTFARWARDLIDVDDVLDRSQVVSLLRPLLSSVAVGRDQLDFYVDEVEYALSRFRHNDLARYVAAERTGRGLTPRVDRAFRQRLIDEVMLPYQEQKAHRGLLDWNDVAIRAAGVTSADYDIVIVDEAQDFSANQVRAISAHLAQDHSTTFVLDAMQRIYPRFFTWSEVGISLRPQHVFRLARNYRNTAEIAAFAMPLVESLPTEDDGTLPDFRACATSGVKPRLVAGKYSDQLQFMLSEILSRVDLTNESVAILQPRGGRWFDYARSLLRSQQIPFCELTRVSTWPTGPESIALSTIHSAKGLEFDHVLLPGLNQEVTPHGDEDGDASLDRLRRLLAMGVGRARRSVMVGYKPGEESTLISLLDPETFEQVYL